MKRSWTIGGIIAFVIVVGAALAIGLRQGRAAGTCPGGASTVSYRVLIQDDKASQPDVKARLCSTLTFINKDTTARLIAFGPHEHHVPYDGVAERLLAQNQSFTITLNKTGMYHWHDHLHDELTGVFTVTK